MRIAFVLAFCALALGMTGCAGAGLYGGQLVMPPPGLAYAQFSAPITTDFTNATFTEKHGSAYTESILGLIANGDCSLQRAAINGSIKRIDYADYTFYNILGIYSKFTVTVYGE